MVLERIPIAGRFINRNKIRFPKNVRYGNIVSVLPVTNGTCKGIYASHVLEHLSLGDFRTALRHTYNLLAEGGVFRALAPDLELLAREYISSEDSRAAETFLKHAGLGQETRPNGLSGLLVSWLGSGDHLWMWDYKGLAAELSEAGFQHIRPCKIGDS